MKWNLSQQSLVHAFCILLLDMTLVLSEAGVVNVTCYPSLALGCLFEAIK